MAWAGTNDGRGEKTKIKIDPNMKWIDFSFPGFSPTFTLLGALTNNPSYSSSDDKDQIHLPFRPNMALSMYFCELDEKVPIGVRQRLSKIVEVDMPISKGVRLSASTNDRVLVHYRFRKGNRVYFPIAVDLMDYSDPEHPSLGFRLPRYKSLEFKR